MNNPNFNQDDWFTHLGLGAVEEAFLASKFPVQLELCEYLDDEPSDIDPDFHEIEWALSADDRDEPGVFLGFVSANEYRRAFADIEAAPHEMCHRKMRVTIEKHDDPTDRKSHFNWGCWLELTRVEFLGWVTDDELEVEEDEILDFMGDDGRDPDVERASLAGDRETKLRKTELRIKNTVKLELYARWIEDSASEFWLVTEADGERIVLNHDALMAQTSPGIGICYAEPGDLVWTDASESDLPARKAELAVENENSLEADPGLFGRLEAASQLLENELKIQRKVWNQAKNDLYGRWSDGVASFEIREDDSVIIDCPDDPSHPLYQYQYTYGVDSMSYCHNWGLVLWSTERKEGLSLGLLHCDREELHMHAGEPTRFAHVFYRDGQPGERPVPEMTSSEADEDDLLELDRPMSIEDIRHRAQEIIDAGLADTVTAYLLENQEREPGDSDINRCCGTAIGVSPETWPQKDGRKMEHAITLDLSSTPKLKAQYPAEIAAVAVFVSSLDENEAFEPGTEETAVLLLTDEDLVKGVNAAAGPANDESESTTFVAHEITLPVEVFAEDVHQRDEDDPVYELYEALGEFSMAGGKPVWLQGVAHDGEIILQFDDSLVDMNLGDGGVMYVFRDTAFWQCH